MSRNKMLLIIGIIIIVILGMILIVKSNVKEENNEFFQVKPSGTPSENAANALKNMENIFKNLE